jgi:uncharacterized protein YfdQ (DUF2303 family)
MSTEQERWGNRNRDLSTVPQYTTETQVEADIMLAAAEPNELDPTKVYTVINPNGSTRETLDLEKFLPAPRRVTGIYKPTTLASFVDYAARHRDAEHTTVWVDPIGFKVTAILNDHAPGLSAWGDHQTLLQLVKTKEWEHWLKHDNTMLKQQDFAEHLEDGRVEIINPDAATLLEIAQTLQGKNDVTWSSANRLSNGEVKFGYSEELQASAGTRGELSIPDRFLLSIAPFYGEDPRSIEALLRYRVREGHVQLGYKLVRPHDVLHEAIEGIAHRLKHEHGFEHVYIGAPA